MMLRAQRGGTSTDSSRDHEYTDWEALDRFVDEFIEQICEPSAAALTRESGFTFFG